MPEVNPGILAWARETAGLSLEEAANKLNINAAYDLEPSERLLQYESGDREPSRPMLKKMSAAYRRPFLLFFLNKIPTAHGGDTDFRTLPEPFSARQEGILDALLRDVKARQLIVRELIESEDSSYKLDFIGSIKMSKGVEEAVKELSNIIGVTHTDLWRCKDSKASFAFFRQSVEKSGIFVLLLKNLGSYHTNIPVDEFRGYALADDVAPFIVINDSDAKPAWPFTLAHELVHLLIGNTGISNYSSHGQVEAFCDAVAAEFLLPANWLMKQTIPLTDFGAAKSFISSLVQKTNLSHSMIAVNLHKAELIDKKTKNSLLIFYRNIWNNSEIKRKEDNKKNSGSPPPQVIVPYRVGAGITNLVGRMISNRKLSMTSAGKVLGVKPHNVPKVFT